MDENFLVSGIHWLASDSWDCDDSDDHDSSHAVVNYYPYHSSATDLLPSRETYTSWLSCADPDLKPSSTGCIPADKLGPSLP